MCRGKRNTVDVDHCLIFINQCLQTIATSYRSKKSSALNGRTGADSVNGFPANNTYVNIQKNMGCTINYTIYNAGFLYVFDYVVNKFYISRIH